LAGKMAGGRKGKRSVSDIFSEVDEEVRREQLKKLWERYGNLLIAVCVLIVASVAGWRAYESWRAKQAAEAGVAFQSAVALAADGKTKEAEEAFAKISATGTSSYRMLAKFREAGEVARTDAKAAVALYDQLAADTGIGPTMQDLATLRAGSLLVDTASYAEVARRLEPLTAAGRTFRHSARGALALAAWRAKDTAAMRKWSDMVLADTESPPGARGQIQMLQALVESEQKS
jgi:hypothetical protein